MGKKKHTKKPSRDSEVRLYAERVRRMTDKQIWEEGHQAPTIDLAEGVIREIHQDLLAVLAPHFDDDIMERITNILGNWYGFSTDIQYVDSNREEMDAAYNVSEDREIKPGKIFRHFKGNYYQVLYLAQHTEAHETMVVYRSCDPAHTDWVFCRPKKSFCEEVDKEKYPEVVQKWRFQRVTEVPK